MLQYKFSRFAKKTAALSVPFSSGQGMLPNCTINHCRDSGVFQSPFHRVKECYARAIRARGACGVFQSPFHRVKECYLTQLYNQSSPQRFFQSPFHRVKECYVISAVSPLWNMSFQSPFHRVKECYQNSPKCAFSCIAFQSPFHRVKECYTALGLASTATKLLFQSPFHRVKECYRLRLSVK